MQVFFLYVIDGVAACKKLMQVSAGFHAYNNYNKILKQVTICSRQMKKKSAPFC